MNIAIGSDHGGFLLKEDISRWLADNGHEVTDYGCDSEESVDYPVYALKVAKQVAAGFHDIGVLVCGTGIGMAMTANKVAGIRAALVNDVYSAAHARRHNDANIIALGGRIVTPEQAKDIVRTFLESEFEAGRHARRVDEIMEVENDWGKK